MATHSKPENRSARKRPTQARVKELLHYDPETGVFTWIGTKAHRVKNGERAGCVVVRGKMRYRAINIDGTPRYEQNLAWLYVNGTWEPEIDHRDRDGLNNRFLNLRPCTSTQNKGNMLGGRGISGLKGAYWHSQRKRWRSQVQFQRRAIHLGLFDTAEEAHAAYCAKARELFGEFARTE